METFIPSHSQQPQQQQQQQQRVKVVAGYALQQRLGSGSFATVYKGVRVPPGLLQQQQNQQQQDNNDSSTSSSSSGSNDKSSSSSSSSSNMPDVVAIKAIARTSEKLTKKVLQNLEIEINILRTYQHPNIVCMHNVQKTDRHFYLILEYCGGGDVQGLIRTRKAGRLTERLTRRLMRDLAAGLKFLWGQELIHRDIKPQNLLLTGALPLDEINDPDATPEEEERRRQTNFPSERFSLKIADFGFARHLQSASLAGTLCGSPLYMAPEILQHHRYDAKADLWSVGTVLFEMIAGKPPFNGENHIDLLRNIQRKAVRLPPDVRVSKACVNLLRLLLNRNPLSRAGFKEFFEACDAFVQLGCEGVATEDTAGSRRIPGSNDLGTIPENDNGNSGSSSGGSPSSSSGSPPSNGLMTVDTTAHQHSQQHQHQIPDTSTQGNLHTHMMQQQQQSSSRLPGANSANTGTNIVSPVLTPSTPTSLVPNANLYDHRNYPTATGTTAIRTRLSPLTQSPPTGPTYSNNRVLAPLPLLGVPAISYTGQGGMPQQAVTTANTYDVSTNRIQSNSVSHSQASSAGDDSGFVMVEHTNSPSSSRIRTRSSPNSSQHYYVTSGGPPVARSNTTNYVKITSAGTKGMLSTSPGTGKLLMGMMGMAPPSITSKESTKEKLEDDLAAADKMIATAEDVGRRAVSIAHLGDSRAYLGMRLILRSTEGGSSLISATPMEGVEEEPEDNQCNPVDHSSTEIMMPARRRSSTLSDKPMTEDDNFAEEMPFAISPEAPAVSLPSRCNMSAYNRSTTNISSMKKSTTKTDPQAIRGSFGEALSCYLKALKMLKGAVGAAQRVSKDLYRLENQLGRNRTTSCDIPKMKRRCEVTGNWLSTQFRGVLERADAANMELSKLAAVHKNEQTLQGKSPETVPAAPVASVEELIYNHALASGRDGAVKHLLGQYEAARACYRSAGLLAETLLMEANVEAEDRRVLESYVDGFAARITELDQLMLHQSRGSVQAVSSSTNMASASGISSRRGSSVVGVIGPPPSSAPSPGFFVGPS